MKIRIRKIAITISFLSTSLAFSIDPSTPINGNLYLGSSGAFEANNIYVYDEESVLRKSGIVKANNRLFRKSRKDADVFIHDRTVGTDVSWINSDTFVVLTGNSDRYRHGILGDDIEATGFAVYEKNRLIANFELSSDMVFETLRPLIAELVIVGYPDFGIHIYFIHPSAEKGFHETEKENLQRRAEM